VVRVGNDFPGRAHLAHRPEINRFIGKFQVRRGQTLAGGAGMHGSIQNAADQQRSLHRIGRLPGMDHVLDRVGQGFEQITVLPWTDIIMGRLGFRITLEPAGEIPARAAGADFQDDGSETIPIAQQDAVRLDRRFSWNLFQRRGSLPQLRGHRRLGQLLRPAAVRRRFPECVPVKERHAGNPRLSAAPRFDERLQDLQGVKIIGFQPTAVDRYGLGDLHTRLQFQGWDTLS
jgi:hypothetical protein